MLIITQFHFLVLKILSGIHPTVKDIVLKSTHPITGDFSPLNVKTEGGGHFLGYLHIYVT